MAKLKRSEVRHFLADLTDKLSGDNGSEWLDGLKKFLNKENPRGTAEVVFAHQWETWKTITIGELKSVKTCIKNLEKVGVEVSRWAGNFLGNVEFSREKRKLELIRLSVAELGFPKGAKLKDIYARAKEQGLDLCSAETGPALRLAYQDQPVGEWILIAMEPVLDSDGGLAIFRVDRDTGDLWLHARCGNPDDVWGPGDQFLFLRRK
jgi:hypothetical protein